jgi:hypothetical protein
LKGFRREPGDRHILAKLARLHWPTLSTKVRQDFLLEKEDRLVWIAIRFLGPPSVVIPVHALRRDREMRHWSLRQSPSSSFLRLEIQLNDAASHDILR